MENGTKQMFVKDLERDLEKKITELKKERQVYEGLNGLKRLMEDTTKKDGVMLILDKLQKFIEKQLEEEIEFYEQVLIELRDLAEKEPDIETNGVVC